MHRRMSISNLVHAPAGDTSSKTSAVSASDSAPAAPVLPSMRYYAGLSHQFPPENSYGQREPTPPPATATPMPDGLRTMSPVSAASPMLGHLCNSSPLPTRSTRFNDVRLRTSPLRATPSPLPLPLPVVPALYRSKVPYAFEQTDLERDTVSISNDILVSKFHSGHPTDVSSHLVRPFPTAPAAVPVQQTIARGGRGRGGRRARNRPFACARCPATFQSRGHKANHEATVHDGKRPHKCAHCPARFGLKWNLATHVRRVHEQQRPFACDHCDMAFAQRYDLKRHSGLLHGTQAGLYKCGCGASFDKRRDLAGHTARVHPENAAVVEDGMAQVLPPLRCA